MKKFVVLTSILGVLCGFSAVYAQQWMSRIPQNQLVEQELSFFDIQKSFNEYWAPYGVQEGYYLADGEKKKAAGWKQFRRWEWYWNDRVDPMTGAFPSASSFSEYSSFMEQHPQLKGTNGSETGNWTSMGPSATGGGYAGLGRLNCVAFSPSSSSVIYAGSASGGIWKSTDSGTSWTPLSDGNPVLGVSDMLVLSGSAGDVIYAATGDRDAADNYSVGVLKSLDGGISWRLTGLNWSLSSLKLIYRLAGDPNNADVLYAATSDGLYGTANGGGSWTKLTSTRFINIKFKPGSSLVMYGSTGSGGDVYLSLNAGVTWSLVLNTTGSRVEIAVSPASPEVVYALISNTSNGLFGVYKSVNSGASYTSIFGSKPNMLGWECTGSDTGGQGWYDLCLAVDPANANNVFAGGVNTWKSTNGGTTWTISNHWSSTCSGIATNIHADKHYFGWAPGTSILYECNDGGLYRSANLGTTWSHIGSGLVISQMYRLGVSQTSSGDVIAGLQDNGTKAMLSNTWRDVIGGDGMECLIDYTNANTQYGELYYGAIYRTDNRWGSSTKITGSITGTAGWVTPYVIDPLINTTLYVGFQDVWKSTNKGTSWTKISAWGGASLKSLAVAPSSPSTICAATGSILYRTTNGGATWSNITGTLPVSTNTILYVTVKHDDPDILWVSLGQFNAECVYKSVNGGVSWTNISTGLPSVPVNCVIQNKQNATQEELYAATDIGVFLKLGDANWVPFFTGLPNVVVMELEIYYAADPAQSKLRAATYGRGLWQSDVYGGSVLNSPPVFIADPIVEAAATAGKAYTSTLAGDATDPNAGDVLVYSKVSGPVWLTIASGGALTGTPGESDTGINDFVVRVDDGKGGSDQATLRITVAGAPVVVAPVAEFTGSPLTITAGQSVQFTDLSVNTPTSWAWSFGGGQTSVLQNPSVTYSVSGSYTVVLTVGNSAGSNSMTKTGYITVNPVPPVSYCTPAGIVNTSDYITTLTLGGQVSATGKGATGYTYYPSTVISLTVGKLTSYSLSPYRTSNRDYWKIWIDFNKDGDFTDAGETILNAANKKGTITGSFTIPVAASQGLTRMRIAMRTNSTMNPCDGKYGGEVEDYPVDIKATGEADGGDGILISDLRASELRLYPNPVTSLLNISIDGGFENATLSLFNMLGTRLEIIRVDSGLLQLDVNSYPGGMYYVVLEDRTQRIVRKFIKD